MIKHKKHEEAINQYNALADGLFGNYEYARTIYKNMIFRKMVNFSTGMIYNGNFSSNMINSYEMMYSMGYLGGISWGYWSTIALLQYYLDPRWISYPSSPDFGRFDIAENGELHKRIDCDSANLSSTAATGLMSVLLPNGLTSFKMGFRKTKRILEKTQNKDVQEKLKDLEMVANELLREKLTATSKKYYSKITSLLTDYLDYGTCNALLEVNMAGTYDLTYIPFIHSALGTTDADLNQVGLWAQPLPLLNMEINGLICTTDSASVLPGFINHLFVSGDIIGESPEQYYELTQITKQISNTNFEPQTKRLIKKCKNKCPLLVARLNDKGQIYGIGPGLKSLNSIVLANMYTNCSKLAAIGSYVPATLSRGDINIKRTDARDGNSMSQIHNDKISAFPGAINILSTNEDVIPSNAPAFTVLSKPVEQTAIFAEQAAKCLESVANNYMVTLLDRLATIGQKRDVTAEEIMRQDNRDTQRFKATIEPFYNGIIYPLADAVAESVVNELYRDYKEEIAAIRESDGDFLLSNTYNLDLFNYEQKQMSSERMSNAVQYAQISQSTGEAMSKEAKSTIDVLFMDMMK